MSNLLPTADQPLIIPSPEDQEEHRRFVEEWQTYYQELRQDPQGWAEFQKQIAEWDSTLMDGLDPEDEEGE